MSTGSETEWAYNGATPPNGQVRWDAARGETGGIEYVPNDRCEPGGMNVRLNAQVIGLVVSPPDEVTEYLDRNADGTIPIPTYYSRFDDFGNAEDEAVHIGPEVEHDGEVKRGCIIGTTVEAALRSLVGGGSYRTAEYTLHDCLPDPCLLTSPAGCIVIAPANRTVRG